MEKTKAMMLMKAAHPEKGSLFQEEKPILEGKEDSYEIVTDDDHLLGEGGESKVYLASRILDNKEFVAKIYLGFSNLPIDKQNRKDVTEFLMRNKNFRSNHLLPLLDCGDIKYRDEDGDSINMYPVDIVPYATPYCKEDKVVKCSYCDLKERVIPSILEAMHVLHEADLVHRDIKPENIFDYDGTIVLGDFGIAGRIVEGIDSSKTKTCRGTVGYTAPEVRVGYVVQASDYFSFGCTIATLYKGRHIYENFIKNEETGDFYRVLSDEGMPLNCPEDEQDIQLLVDALTLDDRKERAGYEDVKLWLEKPEEFDKKWRSCRAAQSQSLPFTCKFRRHEYTSQEELMKAFCEDWDEAKEFLYSGGRINSRFVELVKRMDHPNVVEILTIWDESFSKVDFDRDIGFAKALYFFNATKENAFNCPIYWFSHTFTSMSDIAKAIFEGTVKNKEVIKLLQNNFISWKLEKMMKFQEETHLEIDAREKEICRLVKDTVKEVEDLSKIYPPFAVRLFQYKFAPEEHKQMKTADEIFSEITETPEMFYTAVFHMLKDDDYLAQIVYLGEVKKAWDVKEALKNRVMDKDFLRYYMTEIYIFFEAACTNKEVVREHYYRYGPYSFLYWFIRHLKYYSFHSYSARDEKDKLSKNEFHKDMKIKDMYDKFNPPMYNRYKNVLQMFQDNLLLNYLGAQNDKEITSDNIEAYMTDDFFGIEVPIGFMRYMNFSWKKCREFNEGWKGREKQ